MLARETEAVYLSLGEYVLEHRLFAGFDRKRTTRIVDVNRARKRIRTITQSIQTPLIIDTHHPEGIVPDRVASHIFVLRCDPRILIRRLQRKKWSREKIRENVMGEILDYCYINARSNYAKSKVVQLDTSSSNPKQTVKAALRILSGAKPAILRVDWLRVLEKESIWKYLVEC